VGNLLLLAVFAVGSCCLVAHVYVLNDWAGIHGDLRDPN
jgi:4-hydroxybenzoate polyprenyltransferase